MKSLLASIVAALAIIVVVITAGDVHGVNITVYEAFVATYWLTIPTIGIGMWIGLFSNE